MGSTVRFLKEPIPDTNTEALQCVEDLDALGREPEVNILGADPLALPRRFLQEVKGMGDLESWVKRSLRAIGKGKKEVNPWFSAPLIFTAPKDAAQAVLGLDLTDLAGPFLLRWECTHYLPGSGLVADLPGAYRYGRTHSETIYLKRMVEAERDHRLSLILPPASVAGLVLDFPPQGELLFGIKAEPPLVASGSPGASRLVIEAEAPGEKPILLHEEMISPAEVGTAIPWAERRVDCRKMASRKAKLRIRVDGIGGNNSVVVALSDPVLHRPERGGEMPSVLLLTVDSLRYDYIGKTVNGRSLTPNLDAFKDQAVTVSHGYAGGVNTHLSLPSMMMSHRFLEVDMGRFGERLKIDIPTIAEVLADAGWFVRAFNPDFYFHNVLKGFHRRFVHQPPRNPAAEDTERVSGALSFLKKHRKDPFFLWLHLEDPHLPCLPRVEDAPAWTLPGVPDPGADNPLGRHDIALKHSVSKNPAMLKAVAHYFQAAYRAEVRYADTWIGKVLQGLHDLDLEGNTIVLIHADHGVVLREGNVGGRDSNDGTLRVPMMIRFPDRLPAGVERRGVMSLVDVAPTLLDFLDIPVPASWRGSSRKSWLEGTEPGSTETGIFENGWGMVRIFDLAVIRTPDWRYEVDLLAPGKSPRGKLYHYQGTSGEARDVTGRHPAVTEALDARIRETLRTARDGMVTETMSRSMNKFLKQAGYLPEKEDTN